MAKNKCNVFLSIDDGGDPWTLGTVVPPYHSGLEELGWELWMASAHYARQSKLAAELGGLLAGIAPDGSFDGWKSRGCEMDAKFAAKLLRHAGVEGSAAAKAGMFMDWQWALEGEGRIPKELQAFLDELPARERVGGRLGLGEKGSRVLPELLPAVGDILGGGASEPVPIFVGEESAELISELLSCARNVDGSPLAEIDILSNYFFARGRWLMPLAGLAADGKKKIMHWGGEDFSVAWFPVSQALAVTSAKYNFDESDERHLRNGITAEDRDDLLALARSVEPSRFFGGSKLARAWADQCEQEREIEIAAGPGIGSRPAPSL